MSYRMFTVSLAAAGLVFATQAFAQTRTNTGRAAGAAETSVLNSSRANLNTSRSNIYRQGSPQGAGGSAKSTTVKSSKSNTSD
jgi:hypothetical protein